MQRLAGCAIDFEVLAAAFKGSVHNAIDAAINVSFIEQAPCARGTNPPVELLCMI
jgi:hypothetical protein